MLYIYSHINCIIIIWLRKKNTINAEKRTTFVRKMFKSIIYESYLLNQNLRKFYESK